MEVDADTSPKHPMRMEWDPTDAQLAYLIFRITLGINILIHGLGRILGPGAAGFAAKTAAEFANTPLPAALVHLFLIVLPFAEAMLGTLILLGLFLRWALALGGLLIATLVFGTALRSDWNIVGIQMIYAITYFLLLLNRKHDWLSVDGLRNTEPSPSSKSAPNHS